MVYTVMSLAEPGTEVICPNPGMPELEAMVNFAGATVVPMRLLPENGYRPDLEDLPTKINERTRLIMLINPHNPTGAVLTREDNEAIATMVRDRDCHVFSDEIYSEVHFGGRHESIAAVPGMLEKTIISDGFSKTYAMTGWRLGYGVFPRSLVSHVIAIQRNTVSAAAAFSQRAGLAALEGPRDEVRHMVEEYRRRRDILVEGINRIPRLACPLPGGAFYAFADIRETGMSSVEFADRCIEHGVALLSGTAFGTHGEGFVRLAYATSAEQIAKGLERIEAVARRHAR